MASDAPFVSSDPHTPLTQTHSKEGDPSLTKDIAPALPAAPAAGVMWERHSLGLVQLTAPIARHAEPVNAHWPEDVMRSPRRLSDAKLAVGVVLCVCVC
jgi:hypothetical protein